MTALTLKSYQQSALDALATYARAARERPGSGLCRARRPRLQRRCLWPRCALRVPAHPHGRGKTVLAAHAVPLLAAEWRGTDAPVAVWLVPSDTIRTQTLRRCKPAATLPRGTGGGVWPGLRVCSLDDVAQVPAPQWGRQAVVIVVATIQSFRIDDAGQRNVYSFTEAFEPHFKYALAQGKGAEGGRDLACLHALPDAVVTPEDVAQDPPASWLALWASRAGAWPTGWRCTGPSSSWTRRTTQDGQELHGAAAAEPSCILELTATPIEAKTNVLYHVSAQELAAENMIKLPIVLAEHPEGLARRRVWRGADAAQAGSRGAERRGRGPRLCAAHRAVPGAERGRRDAARETAQLPHQ